MQARAAVAARCQASSTDRTHLFYILRGLLKMDKRKTWNQTIFQYDSFQVSLGGSGEIRTHEPLRVTAFRVRPVMTTSIRFQIKTPYIARYDSIYGVWWTGVDSNHRKLSWQIYSLLPLATREPVHINVRALLWSRRWDLNPQPTDYKSVALPIELFRLFMVEDDGLEPPTLCL